MEGKAIRYKTHQKHQTYKDQFSKRSFLFGMKNTSLAFSSVIWEVSCSSLRFPLGVSVKRCRGFQTSKLNQLINLQEFSTEILRFSIFLPHKQGGSENPKIPKAKRRAARVFF